MGRKGSFATFIVAAISTALSFPHASTVTLAMEIHRSNDGSEILLSGQVEAGDFQNFKAAAGTDRNLKVFLTSPGGLIAEGLQIGALIRERGFSTAVPNGAICASACGLIWLAGVSRSVEGNGQVGFHAIYVPDNNLSISAPGNALVGSYMARLGFDDLAIVYATEAGPNEMRWLTPSTASFLGISVTWNTETLEPIPNLSILSRAQIDDALLRKRSAKLFKAKLPGTYNRIIDQIFAAQAKGLNWTSALLYGVSYSGPTTDSSEVTEKYTKRILAIAAKVYAPEVVEAAFVRPLILLQSQNPTLCSTAEIDDPKVVDSLFKQDLPESEKWRADIIEMGDNIIEMALSDDMPESIEVSAVEKEILNKWIQRQTKAFITTLSQNEINFLRTHDMGPRVRCRFNINLFTALGHDRTMAGIFLRDAFAHK